MSSSESSLTIETVAPAMSPIAMEEGSMPSRKAAASSAVSATAVVCEGCATSSASATLMTDAAAAATKTDQSLVLMLIPPSLLSLGFSALRRPVERKQQCSRQSRNGCSRGEELCWREAAPQGAKRSGEQIAEKCGEEPQRDGRRRKAGRREPAEQPETDRQDVQLAGRHHHEED